MLIGYARVSTVDQAPTLQSDALKKAGCERIYEETASGTKADRPELAKALDHMRKGDTLVVWKLDRLAGSMKQLIETVGKLEAEGVKFRSITENIGTDSAGGRFVFHIFGALAEFERSLIRERTNAGLKAARARGRKGGRPKAMTAEDVRIAEKLLASDFGLVEVAKRLKVSRATLFRHLKQSKQAYNSGAGDDRLQLLRLRLQSTPHALVIGELDLFRLIPRPPETYPRRDCKRFQSRTLAAYRKNLPPRTLHDPICPSWLAQTAGCQ